MIKLMMGVSALGLLISCSDCGGSLGSSGPGSGSSTTQIIVACATVDIGRTLPEIGLTIYQDVKQILEAGSTGWEQALLDVAAKYGADTLECAIKAAYDALTSHPPGTMTPPLSPAATRAKAFMVAHHYVYAP